MVGKMVERLNSLSPGGHFRGGDVREDIALSPRTSPHVNYLGVGMEVGDEGAEHGDCGFDSVWGGWHV
jgi:hypothetical protein